MAAAGRKWILVTWLIALGIGIGLGAAIPAVVSGAAGDAVQAPGRGPAVSRGEIPRPVLAVGGPDFREVVKEAIPSVVTVRSQRTVEVSRTPFSFIDPFEEFFGPGPGSRRREPRTEKYIQRGLGSGVIVSDRGYVLTNNHVVEDSSKIEVVLSDGKVVPAKVKGTDRQSDVAVLQIDAGGLRPIALGRSADLEVGEWVLAIGNPFAEALAHTVTAGIVSAKGRSNLNLADYEDFIQTDAAINPGNSGGALVNTRGELVGINTAIVSGSGGYQGIGFAIPIDMARQIMDTLIQKGKVVRGYIGVTIQDLTPAMAKAAGIQADKGAIVANVAKGGPGFEAGLKQGDAIIAIDGHPVDNKDDLRNRIASTAPGTTVRLTVERAGQKRDITVKLGELPSQSERAESQGGGAEEGLGLSVRTLTPQMAEQYGYEGEEGVIVVSVEQGSAAEEAGLTRGDLIKEVNRRPIRSVTEFREALSRRAGADVALLLVRRGEDTFYVTVQNPEGTP